MRNPLLLWCSKHFQQHLVHHRNSRFFSTAVFERLSKELNINKKVDNIDDDSDDDIDLNFSNRDSFRSHRHSTKRTVLKPQIIDMDEQMRDYEEISQASSKIFEETEREPRVFEEEKFPARNTMMFATSKATQRDGTVTFRIDAEQLENMRVEATRKLRKKYEYDPQKSLEELDAEIIEAFKLFGVSGDPNKIREWSGLPASTEDMEEAREFPSAVIDGRAEDDDVETVHIGGKMRTTKQLASAPSDPFVGQASIDDEDVDDMNLSPAQLFFRENKHKLVERARQHFAAGQISSSQMQMSQNDDESANWASKIPASPPVVRPPKDHYWDFGSSGQDVERETVILEAGRLPTLEEILKILEQEHVADVAVVDLEAAGRRDLGRFALVGTAQNAKHAQRVGKYIAQMVQKLDIPFVSAYCSIGSWHGGDDHVVSHLGPIKVHLMTDEGRQRYNVETAWLHPNEHYGQPGEFPAYWDYDQTLPAAYLLRNHAVHDVHISPEDEEAAEFEEGYRSSEGADDGYDPIETQSERVHTKEETKSKAGNKN